MTEAMPFLQKAILLSYDPRPFGQGGFLSCSTPRVHFSQKVSIRSSSACFCARSHKDTG